MIEGSGRFVWRLHLRNICGLRLNAIGIHRKIYSRRDRAPWYVGTLSGSANTPIELGAGAFTIDTQMPDGKLQDH